MRVHALDEKYEVSKEKVKQALALAELPSHTMSTLDEDQLKEFEAALQMLDQEELPVERGDGEPAPEFSNEEKEGEATGVSMEPIEGEELSSEEVIELQGSVAPDGAVVADPIETVDSFEDADDVETFVGEDAIPMVDRFGAFRENLLLSPDLADSVREALKVGEKVADGCLYPERGELVVVTWPNMRRMVVRIG